MAWGLEARVPFLDKEFLEVAMNVDPAEKMFSKGSEQQFDEDGKPRMEKYIIRKAFDLSPDGKPYLPSSILWRQKEQFSDGVGYSWIDGMKDHAAQVVSDEAFAARAERWPRDTPDTKEAYYIREVFDSLFPSEAAAQTAVRYVAHSLMQRTLAHHSLDGFPEATGVALLILAVGVSRFTSLLMEQTSNSPCVTKHVLYNQPKVCNRRTCGT